MNSALISVGVITSNIISNIFKMLSFNTGIFDLYYVFLVNGPNGKLESNIKYVDATSKSTYILSSIEHDNKKNSSTDVSTSGSSSGNVINTNNNTNFSRLDELMKTRERLLEDLKKISSDDKPMTEKVTTDTLKELTVLATNDHGIKCKILQNIKNNYLTKEAGREVQESINTLQKSAEDMNTAINKMKEENQNRGFVGVHGFFQKRDSKLFNKCVDTCIVDIKKNSPQQYEELKEKLIELKTSINSSERELTKMRKDVLRVYTESKKNSSKKP